MIATQLPPIRILPISDIGDHNPVGRLHNEGPDTRRPYWWLVGGHHGSSRLTASRLGDYQDEHRPPSLAQIAEAVPYWKPCDCRQCRQTVLVWAWWGAQAVQLARDSAKSVARA